MSLKDFKSIGMDLDYINLLKNTLQIQNNLEGLNDRHKSYLNRCPFDASFIHFPFSFIFDYLH